MFIMSKKKNKSTKKIATNVSYRMKNGAVKVRKGEYMDISESIQFSTEQSILSRLDNIISKEDVLVDTSDCKVSIKTLMTNELYTAEAIFRLGNKKVHTIVIPVSKKEAISSFDFLEATILSAILRTGTLGYVYNNIAESWKAMNEENTSSFTNVLYVPKVLEFIDFNKGKVRKCNLFNINVLVVALPSKNAIIEEVKSDDNDIDEKDVDSLLASRVIADICDAAIKCGCKDLIIDPFGYKFLEKDKTETSSLWKQITTSQRFIENIDSVTFTTEDNSDYVVFSSANHDSIV